MRKLIILITRIKRTIISLLKTVSITAILMVLVTILIYNVNVSAFKLEKYKQTIALCGDFNSWYRYDNVMDNKELVEVKRWEGSILDRDSLWNCISTEEKKERLRKNMAMDKLLMYFEDAKMLDQKKLLDKEYFHNSFFGLISRLESVSEPTIDEFIEHVRRKYNGDDIWDGYHYCVEKILKIEK